jgi:hypothetical protein
VKSWANVVMLLLSFAVLKGSAQSASEGQSRSPEAQASGVWTDPSTGLMWAAKDNGKDVSWKGAVKYCRVLRLAGFSNWRLATLAELGAIFDRNANAPGLAGPGKESPDDWHVKGNLFLTGDEWSSERRKDDRGDPNGYAWYFDFNEGTSKNDPIGFLYSHSLMRALCVRGSHK